MQTTEGMVAAFQRLVRRVLDGRVIPFVGAGISLDARVPGDPKFYPAVWWMREEAEKSLAALCRDEIPVALGRSMEGDKPVEKLDQLADLLTWLKGASYLCQKLRIEAFARLSPLPVHRFLAYLGREGLITEIITTNYDTCIEQAFRDTFGPAMDEHGAARAKDALAVIFNLAHYRAHAGRNRTDHGDPVLHLYKMNGDAADYQAALDEHERDPDPDELERRAARIIVTERQLQTFRDELWAKDLYADRARSRSLLFCGFGSEEPQVRHHAMALMEEMQRQSRPVSGWEQIPELPNAPFFAVFEEKLQFNQLQILAGFAMAHTRVGTPASGAPVLKAAYANALLGQFGEVLSEPKPNADDAKPARRLPADLFFEKLFQAAWLRRAHEELKPGGVLPTWLSSIVREHRAWAGWLAEQLGSTRFEKLEEALAAQSEQAPDAVRNALFGLAAQLFAQEKRPLLFMQWIQAVATGGEPLPEGTDFYLSLREAALFILLTLLLILWITGVDDPTSVASRIAPEPGVGLRLTLRSDDPRIAERNVYLVREGVQERSLLWREPIPNLLWLIEIPGNDQLAHLRSLPIVSGGRPSPLQAVRVERRSAAAIVRTARTPGAGPFDVLTRVFSTAVPDEMP